MPSGATPALGNTTDTNTAGTGTVLHQVNHNPFLPGRLGPASRPYRGNVCCLEAFDLKDA